MARMYPDSLRQDTKSSAERRLYSILASGLPNDYTVFHSVAWQVPDLRGGATDGEADFIVAHPSAGILLLEVKGGAIQFDGQAGQWFSNSQPIKDPFRQATDNKYSLLRILKAHPFFHSKYLDIGHAVAFPDVIVNEAFLRPDAPRQVILDAKDVGDINSWVASTQGYWRSQSAHVSSLGEAGIRALAEILSPSWDLKLQLGVMIKTEAEEIRRLTEEQFSILDILGRTRRAAISGCAGSGKTTLAVEKATRLAKQGARVLLTCFNRFLAEHLASSFTGIQGVEVASFHAVSVDWARRSGLLTGSISQEPSFFADSLPELLMKAAEELGPRYDALVIDEGQDFLAHWWVPLQCLLRDPDHGLMYIFYDDNQKLYGTESTIIPQGLAPADLAKNLRNTQAIHRAILRFYHSETIPIAVGPSGRPVEVHIYQNAQELKQILRRTLHHLIVDEAVPPEDIVVLTPRSRERSELWRFGELGNYRLTDNWATGGAEIFTATIHSFKGLESPVVILAEIDSVSAPNLEIELYVGCSRAVSHLVVIATAETAHLVT